MLQQNENVVYSHCRWKYTEKNKNKVFTCSHRDPHNAVHPQMMSETSLAVQRETTSDTLNVPVCSVTAVFVRIMAYSWPPLESYYWNKQLRLPLIQNMLKARLGIPQDPLGAAGTNAYLESKVKNLLCTMMSVSCHWRVTLIVIYIQVYTHNCASTIPRSTKYSEYSVPRQFGCGSVHLC